MIKIKEMTTQHLINRIAWLKRYLKTKPERQFYSGISDYGDDWVEQENRLNDEIEESIKEEIEELNKELILRY